MVTREELPVFDHTKTRRQAGSLAVGNNRNQPTSACAPEGTQLLPALHKHDTYIPVPTLEVG